jgi:hypothetical protein
MAISGFLSCLEGMGIYIAREKEISSYQRDKLHLSTVIRKDEESAGLYARLVYCSTTLLFGLVMLPVGVVVFCAAVCVGGDVLDAFMGMFEQLVGRFIERPCYHNHIAYMVKFLKFTTLYQINIKK